MPREIFYTFNASAPPPDPTVNSTKYTAPLAYPVGGGYYKAIAREDGVVTAVVSKSFERAPTDYIVYYPFSGNTNDAGGNGHHLTNNGATLTTDRLSNANSAYSFDGVNDYMIREDTDLGFNGQTEFSIYFEFQSSDTSGRIIQKQINDVWKTFAIYFIGNKISFSLQNNSLSQYPTWETTSTINSNWHRVCITFKKNAINATDGKMVIDGIEANTTYTANSYASNFVMQEVSSDLLLGVRPVTMTDYYSGILDEIKIFNRALTSEEAIQLTTE